MSPAITADWLLARVVEQAGCLIWQGRCENGGRDPRASVDGTKFYVRQAVWEATHGKAFPAGCYAGCSCDEARCVDPAHVVARKRAAVHRGKPKTLAHRANIAAAKRAVSKLPQASVQDILLSPLPGAKEAARHGISKDMVNRIRAGELRRDYSSPFQGLGAR